MKKCVTLTTILAVFCVLLSVYALLNFSDFTNPSSGSAVSKILKVHFLNVGQGDSILIVAPNGNTMLIDAGQANNFAREEVGKIFDTFNHHIDVLMGTHPDSDHIGGFSSILNSYTYGMYIDPAFSSDTETYKDLILKIEGSKNNTQKITARRGVKFILDSENNVSLSVLYPDLQYVIDKFSECSNSNLLALQNSKSTSTKNKGKLKAKTKGQNKPKSVRQKDCSKSLAIDSNDMSIVARLEYGSTSFMLTGDASISVEHFLHKTFATRSGTTLGSTVLKIGHHGSKTSTSNEFLNDTTPEFAIISAGKNNRYGHPHKDVLARINSFRVLRTDQLQKTISIFSDGSKVWTK